MRCSRLHCDCIGRRCGFMQAIGSEHDRGRNESGQGRWKVPWEKTTPKCKCKGQRAKGERGTPGGEREATARQGRVSQRDRRFMTGFGVSCLSSMGVGPHVARRCGSPRGHATGETDVASALFAGRKNSGTERAGWMRTVSGDSATLNGIHAACGECVGAVARRCE